MPKLRIATFNAENLFARYKFNSKKKVNVDEVLRDGWLPDKTCFDINSKEEKKVTSDVIKAVKADVIALQEVECLDVLKRFRSNIMKASSDYPYVMLVDGNDPRLIDVAILSKYPIRGVQSYQHLKDAVTKKGLFSRDCLEADIEVDGKTLTLYVNHFKSMMEGRSATSQKRARQAEAVKDIIKKRFGDDPSAASFVVLGDFNDYPETDSKGSSAVASLSKWNAVEDVIGRLPQAERWTHYYAKEKAYKQLDYLLLSKSLANKTNATPYIERRGLTTKAVRVTDKRFKNVSDKCKASDHCPMAIDIEL